MPRLEGVLKGLQDKKKKFPQVISVSVDQPELMAVVEQLNAQIAKLNEYISSISDGMSKVAAASDSVARGIPSAQSVASLIDLSPVIRLLEVHSELLVELASQEMPKMEPVDLSPVLRSIAAIDIPEPIRPIPPKEEWTARVVEHDKNGRISEVVFS